MWAEHAVLIDELKAALEGIAAIPSARRDKVSSAEFDPLKVSSAELDPLAEQLAVLWAPDNPRQLNPPLTG